MKFPVSARFMADLFAFTFRKGRRWLLPVLVVFLLVSVVAAVGALTPYSVFVYPL